MRHIYTGVGSRKTPHNIIQEMYNLAEKFAKAGWLLRTGDALGADLAFYNGCVKAGGKKEVYKANDAEGDEAAYEYVRKYHPAPNSRPMQSRYVWNLMARNTYQVLGRQLDTPADLLVCWTPDGCQRHEDRTYDTGGTGQAISIASAAGIPVINMARADWQELLVKTLKELK